MTIVKRSVGVVGLLMALVLLLAACSTPASPAAPAATEASPQAATTSETTEATPENTPATTEGTTAEPAAEAPLAIKVGLVTDVGRVNDRSFNQSAWMGVQNYAAAAGLGEGDFRYIETQAPTDYADNIQQFIDAGFPVIVTVGFALGEATITAAKANPDIYFIGVDQFQTETLPNVVGLVFHEDQAGFLAGALAASLTKSGTIAAVLGTDLIPPVVAYKEGYEAGARYINPDINIISTYHPGELSQAFIDPEWGAATARQAMDQGADVVFGAGGQTGNGALQEAATEPGLYCIGVDTDQWDTLTAAHPCLVSSAMKLITPAIEQLIVTAADGSFTGGNFYGSAGLAPFHDFEDQVPQEVKDKLAEIDASLKDGSITTGYGQ
jgi:basic membrane protein A